MARAQKCYLWVGVPHIELLEWLAVRPNNTLVHISRTYAIYTLALFLTIKLTRLGQEIHYTQDLARRLLISIGERGSGQTFTESLI